MVKVNSLLPPIYISSGTLEAVKWLALLCMTIDHTNRFFFDSPPNNVAYCIGRLSMPLFAFIFAYNLAQPNALAQGLYSRVIKRLLLFGLLATPPYLAMRHLEYFFPLNIMLMLAVATATLFFYEQESLIGRFIGFSVFLIGGPFVEYNWIGVFFCVNSWFYCKKPSVICLLAYFVAFFLLGELNGNNWDLLSVLIIIAATKINLKFPRIPHFFYYYYLIHLWTLYLLSSVI